MDYFVSIENTAYFHWQLELLIESFKIHELEDRLLVAIAENTNPLYASFAKNVKKHKRFFIHPNLGKHLNCYESLVAAIHNGLIEMPLTVIHPDMLLVKPVEITTNHNIVFSYGNREPELFERIEPDIQSAVDAFALAREDAPKTILPGDVIVFNDGDIGDINQIKIRIKHLGEKYGTDWNIVKAGIILALYDLLSRKYHYRVEFLENTLLHDSLGNFIHYQHGLPPVFSKLYHKYDSPEYVSGSSFPMQQLLEHNPTVATDYAQKVVRSYLNFPI